MARVIIVRHAQSEANRDGGALGRLDSPLTELGRQQAEAVGAALRDLPMHDSLYVLDPLLPMARNPHQVAIRRALAHQLALALEECNIP